MLNLSNANMNNTIFGEPNSTTKKAGIFDEENPLSGRETPRVRSKLEVLKETNLDKRDELFSRLESVLEIMAAQGKGLSRRENMGSKQKHADDSHLVNQEIMTLVEPINV